MFQKMKNRRTKNKGLMLSFPSQNDKKKIPTGRVYSKKQIRVTANQHVFKSGPVKRFSSTKNYQKQYNDKNYIRNNFLHNKSEENIKRHAKQRNVCVFLLKIIQQQIL